MTMTGVTAVTEFNIKSDMSRWTRAHAGVPGICWATFQAPDGEMVVADLDRPRRVPSVAVRPAVTVVPPRVRDWTGAAA